MIKIIINKGISKKCEQLKKLRNKLSKFKKQFKIVI